MRPQHPTKMFAAVQDIELPTLEQPTGALALTVVEFKKDVPFAGIVVPSGMSEPYHWVYVNTPKGQVKIPYGGRMTPIIKEVVETVVIDQPTTPEEQRKKLQKQLLLAGLIAIILTGIAMIIYKAKNK